MITEKMSYQEIADRFDKIYGNRECLINQNPYRRFFVKNRKATNVVFTPKKRTVDENSYVLIIPKSSGYKEFMRYGLMCSMYLIYGTRKGKMLVSKEWDSGTNMQHNYFYTSHFFDRYRERVLKDCTLPKDTVMAEYFKRNIETTCKTFENGYKGAERSFLEAMNDGVALGVYIDSCRRLYKTFVDYGSLSKNKQQVLDYMGNRSNEVNEMMRELHFIMSVDQGSAQELGWEIKIRGLLDSL